jgi:hypothetical protein
MIVRFLQDCRDGLSWFKGDLGTLHRTLVERPQASSGIHIIEVRGRNVWATDEDFIEWHQLSLF